MPAEASVETNALSLDSARLLLEADEMLPLFAQLPLLEDGRPREAELVALWVKPGRYFNTHYRTELSDGRSMQISAFLLSPERADRVTRPSRREHRSKLARKGLCPHCSVLRIAENLVLQAFPLDYRLPTLADCLDAKTVRRQSEGLIAAKRCDPVAYRPGMRCQIRIRERGGRTSYGKVSVERRGEGRGFALHQRAYEALRERGSALHVAAPRTYLPKLGMAVVSGVDGVTYHSLLHEGGDLSRATELAAQAAYELHRLDTRLTDRSYSVAEELELVRSWVDLVARLCPALSDGLHRWYQGLCVDPPPDCSARAVLHRDFYDKQLLIHDDAPVLLDMDTICAGDAELDVGNFRAHLYLRGLQWDRPDRFIGLEHAFVRHYPGLLSEQRMQWYRSVALLRLACGYALRPRWRHLVPTMIEEVGP